jgi:hypothetical protein
MASALRGHRRDSVRFDQRIEVLKDGASSAYGSDAIAGVVNIILKKSYQGRVDHRRWGYLEPRRRHHRSCLSHLRHG